MNLTLYYHRPMTGMKNCTKSMFLQPRWPGNSLLMQMYMPCVFGYMYPDCMFRQIVLHSPCTYTLVLCMNLQSVLRTLWAGMVQPRFLYWCAQHSMTQNQSSHRLTMYMLNCTKNRYTENHWPGNSLPLRMYKFVPWYSCLGYSRTLLFPHSFYSMYMFPACTQSVFVWNIPFALRGLIGNLFW